MNVRNESLSLLIQEKKSRREKKQREGERKRPSKARERAVEKNGFSLFMIVDEQTRSRGNERERKGATKKISLFASPRFLTILPEEKSSL